MRTFGGASTRGRASWKRSIDIYEDFNGLLKGFVAVVLIGMLLANALSEVKASDDGAESRGAGNAGVE